MATPWGSAFDQDTVVEQACGPGMHWDAAQNGCVPDATGEWGSPAEWPGRVPEAGFGGEDPFAALRVPSPAAPTLGDVDWREIQQQAALDLLNDPNWAGNRPTLNQPVPNTSTGETLSGKDALARLNDPGWGGNWTPEELAYFNAAQEAGFFDSPAASAATVAPAATVATNDSIPGALGEFDFNAAVADAGGIQAFLEDAAGFGDVPAAEVYSQQGIVDPGIDAAEQAWLDSFDFTGDLGTVPAGQTMSTYDPDNPLLGDQVVDPRVQMRQDYAEQLLNEGYTVADIEQFLGVVGTEAWADSIGVDPADMVTKTWLESPEFAEMYGSDEDFVSVHEAHVAGGPRDGDGPGGDGPGGDGPGGDGPGGDGPAGDGEGGTPVPDGVPTYVSEQVDRIDIIDNRLKEIGDALTKARDLGLGEIDTIEAELRAAEQSIYDSQYGTIDPITGEIMNPGEMDRLLTTYRERRTKSKKTRADNRANIVAIMAAEGVDAGLAQTELDMIGALHGDAVDTAYNYIDSLWRIGKMSHDERDSMISNMMGSYRLQLRDQVVEMLMAEEITAADQRFVANQEALSADTIADLFPNMTENQVYGLMGAGLGDLLELPGEKEIGMITSGEWAGYTSGQKANVLVSAGWTQNADGSFTAPAADADDADPTGMITTGEWAGYTEADKSAAYLRAGYTQDATGKWVAPDEAGTDEGLKVPIPLGTLSELGLTAAKAREAGYTLSNIQYDPAQIGRILDATVIAMGTSADFSNIASEQRLAEATDLSYAGLITEGPYAGYTQAQKTVAEAANENPTGMITEGTWAGVTFGEKARALNAQGIDPETGLARSGDDVEPEDKKYRMESRRLTERGIKIGSGTDFEEFGRSQYGGHVTEPFVMISVQQWADLTGEYMFPAADEADADWKTTLFPSGVKTADVPGLPFDAEGGEYLMDIEALAVFGPLQEAMDAEQAETDATFAGKTIVDILQESGHGMYSQTQQAVNTLMSKNMHGTSTKWKDAGLSETALWLYTVEQAASHDVEYAQVWANYTGVDAIVNAVTDAAGRVTTPAQTISPDPEYIR